MLYWLLFVKLYHYFPPFRIFRYLTFRTAFASLTALFTGLTALFAGFLWWETLTHDTLALKPSVAIYTGADPDTPPVGISITNWPWDLH